LGLSFPYRLFLKGVFTSQIYTYYFIITNLTTINCIGIQIINIFQTNEVLCYLCRTYGALGGGKVVPDATAADSYGALAVA
ncbi:MAG: hypothetical protein K2F88_09590, partial [Duncaniella sp.]|nr:hypothetical protein [Duncaniella sp.]